MHNGEEMNIETEKFLIDKVQWGHRPMQNGLSKMSLAPVANVLAAYITCKNCSCLCQFNSSERMMMLLVDCPCCKAHEAVPVSKLN